MSGVETNGRRITGSAAASRVGRPAEPRSHRRFRSGRPATCHACGARSPRPAAPCPRAPAGPGCMRQPSRGGPLTLAQPSGMTRADRRCSPRAVRPPGGSRGAPSKSVCAARPRRRPRGQARRLRRQRGDLHSRHALTLAGWASTCNGRPPPFAADHPVRGDRPWAHPDSARGGGDGAVCCTRPRHVRGRGGPSSLRRAPRLHQVSHRKGLEWVLQVGVRQAHDLPPREGLHARLRQGGDARRHAATSARLSLSDPVLAKRGRRHLREPAHVRPPPRRDPLLRHGVDAQPRNAALAPKVCASRWNPFFFIPVRARALRSLAAHRPCSSPYGEATAGVPV